MKANIVITDTTAVSLDRFSPTPAALGEFIGLLLGAGATLAEVLPAQFLSLQNLADPRRLIVRVAGADELTVCRDAGAVSFVAKNGLDLDSDAVCEITAPLVRDLPENPAFLSDACHSIRLRGLSDIMADYFPGVFAWIRDRIGPEVTLDFGNGYHCATAASVEWLLAGGSSVCASFAGVSGGAATEELLAAQNVLADAEYDLTTLPRIRRIFEQMTLSRLRNFKPVAGTDIFAFESGIHADGIFKNPANYEPFRPESVGASRRLVIGKHSGRGSVLAKLRELSLPEADALLPALNDAVRGESIRLRRSLTDPEFMHLYKLAAKGGSADGARG